MSTLFGTFGFISGAIWLWEYMYQKYSAKVATSVLLGILFIFGTTAFAALCYYGGGK